MSRGRYVLVVGPSGSGKNTLMQAAREVFPDLAYAVSATTRLPRAGETDGVSYHFLTREAFMAKVAAGAFLEWAEYGGNLYGTLRDAVMPFIEAGSLVMSDIEVQGARLVRESLGREDSCVIYIDAGSWDELVPRITARAPIAPDALEKRRLRYEDEASFKAEADYVVANRDGELETAKAAFIAIISALREKAA